MPVDKDATGVAAMFSAIAPRYDLVNHLLSAGLDRYWRETAVAVIANEAPARVVDVAAGTGDLARALFARTDWSGQVLLVDFALPMLRRSAGKGLPSSRSAMIAADGLRLPLRPESVDAVMAAFGVRNYADVRAGLREAARVLRPRGTLVVLEFCGGESRRLPWPLAWFISTLVPTVGRLVSGHAFAYRYLCDSIAGFASKDELAALFQQGGFSDVRSRDLSFGVCTLIVGRKADTS